MDYATTQAIGFPTTHELIITEEGNFKHRWDVTGSANFDGPPPIVPEAPQLDGQKSRWPGQCMRVVLFVPGFKRLSKGMRPLDVQANKWCGGTPIADGATRQGL